MVKITKRNLILNVSTKENKLNEMNHKNKKINIKDFCNGKFIHKFTN